MCFKAISIEIMSKKQKEQKVSSRRRSRRYEDKWDDFCVEMLSSVNTVQAGGWMVVVACICFARKIKMQV